MSKHKITTELLDEVKLLYPDCEIFETICKPNYIGIRSFIGKSKFYKDDKTSFDIKITSVEYLHVSEAILETKGI